MGGVFAPERERGEVRDGSLHTTTNAVPKGVSWLVVATVTVARLDSTIRETYSQGCE